MKKILPSLILISFLAVLLVPMIVWAQGPPEACTITRDVGVPKCSVATIPYTCEFDNPVIPCGICCLMQAFYNITDWIFFILIAIAGLFVILGAMNIIMAGGDPEKVATGRKYIMYAFIGLIVAFLARAIPAIARSVIGT